MRRPSHTAPRSGGRRCSVGIGSWSKCAAYDGATHDGRLVEIRPLSAIWTNVDWWRAYAASDAPESGRQTLHGRYPAATPALTDRNATRCTSIVRRACRHVGRHMMLVVSEPT